MKEVDLHGVRHRDVYKILEDCYMNGDIPLEVITGKSNTMKKIVVTIAGTFGLQTREKLGNDGRLVVYEDR